MKVTSIGGYRPEPGTYLEWAVELGDGSFSPVPPSFNQRFHLSSALSGTHSAASTVWIAAAFDVNGPIDVDALAWSFSRFVERHPALRTTFAAEGGVVVRRIHDASDVELGRPRVRTITDASAMGEHLRSRFAVLCHPSRSPSYAFAAVSRDRRSTVICAFDHAHADAVSMTVAVDELSRLYEARVSGRSIRFPPVGSFVDYCAAENDAATVPASDPRIAAWRKFVESCNGSTPAFPFDLGVATGVRASQATTVHPLMTAAETDTFERTCRQEAAGVFAGVSAAIAEASARIGGPAELPMLFPLHTRADDRFAHAVGWFTTNAPMTVTVGDDFASTLASAQRSFRAALPLSTVPIPRVLEALGAHFVRRRDDVFMVSYVDYRRLPGADSPHLDAHHISNETTADDAQFWVSRTADGLFLRARFPDTPEAHAVLHDFVTALTAVVQSVVAHAAELRKLSLVGPTA